MILGHPAKISDVTLAIFSKNKLIKFKRLVFVAKKKKTNISVY